MKRVETVFSPVDEAWGLNASAYSARCAQTLVWLSGLLPYEQCQAVFERVGQRLFPSSSIWRQTRSYGEKLSDLAQAHQHQVNPERIILSPVNQDHSQAKGVSLDGGMIHIRGEGWKEMKVGTIFDIELRLERDPHSQEWSQQAHATQTAYCAVLGDAKTFAPTLWQLAVQKQVPTATCSSVTADGAEWIWTLADDYFPESTQIVDWYHACQHLSAAAHALFPDQATEREKWLRQGRDHLFQGAIHTITHPLDAAHLTEHSRYFHTHKRRMQYQEFREEGYPIGSGTVESGVKQFKHRLTGAGMRWSRSAAQQMLLIRAAVLQGNFDTLWQQVA